MGKINGLEKLGGIGDYRAVPRMVVPFEPVVIPGAAAVKFYTLFMRGKEFDAALAARVSGFVKDRFSAGAINPRSGLGFAILSEGVLSVSMWGGNYPSLLNPNVHTFQEGKFPEGIARANVEQVGAYCVWEAALVGYEAEAWRRYLFANGGVEAREAYLADVARGIVQVDFPHMGPGGA